jgi:hypothetical protein
MDDNNQSIDLKEVIRSPPAISTVEIIVLYGNSNGRCCAKHDKCGRHFDVSDTCHLVRSQVQINNEEEDAIALVKPVDGTEACTAGLFLVQC